MAVVNIYNRSYPDPSLMPFPRAIDVDTAVRALFADPAIANGNSATSKIYLGRAPSWWRVLPTSLIVTPGIAGVTDFDVGLIDSVGGTAVADCLANGLDLHTAGNFNPAAAVTPANANKRLWQLLGLSADPKRALDIVATMNTASTAAGTLGVWLFFGSAA